MSEVRHPSVTEKTDLAAKTSPFPIPPPFFQIQIFKSLVRLVMGIPEHLVPRARHPVCPKALLGLLLPLCFAGNVHVLSSPFIVFLFLPHPPIS